MGMHGERNTWLSCTVVLRMLNKTPLAIERQTQGRRAREGSEQCACRGLEHDRDPARQRIQQQGELKKGESEQEREDNDRVLEPEPQKGLVRT